jgi:hypothetical protein
MNWTRLLIICAVLYGALHSWQNRTVHHRPGIIAASDPVQENLGPTPAIDIDGYQITPLAEFSARARVLSIENYYADRGAKLVPTDFALGWGPMSDEKILKDISISQSGRFYFWSVSEFPIPREQIETHSANMHLIPADKYIEKQLKTVRQGQVIQFSGYLVEAKSPEGWKWRSSMSRSDTGNGACELVLVKSVNVAPGA